METTILQNLHKNVNMMSLFSKKVSKQMLKSKNPWKCTFNRLTHRQNYCYYYLRPLFCKHDIKLYSSEIVPACFCPFYCWSLTDFFKAIKIVLSTCLYSYRKHLWCFLCTGKKATCVESFKGNYICIYIWARGRGAGSSLRVVFLQG